MIGRLIVHAAGLALVTALLHGCAAQGSDAQVAAGGNGGGEADLGTAPIIDVEVTPNKLDAGGSVTITWTTQRATSCTANGDWKGAVAVNNTSGLVLGPLAAGTYTYGVTCEGPGGTTSVSQPVEVGAIAAPLVALSLTPSSLQPGNSATLSWSTTNASTCVGSGGTGSDAWATNQPTASSGFNTGAINTAGSYEYNLTCTGSGGSSEASKLINVSASATPAAPTISGFTATPSQILPGQSTTFTWSSNATSCAASGGSGSDGWVGSEPASSTGTVVGPISAIGRYAYTLTCSGPGGNSASTIQVAVSASTTPLPVSVSIGVLPLQIVAGNAASLTWSTSNASACTASGSWAGAKQLIGVSVPTAVLTTPGVYTYTLTCVGSLGTSGSATTSLTVTAAPATVGSFAATPAAILIGGSTSLSWNANGATSCIASGGTGSDGWTGAVPTSSAGTSVGPIATAGTYTYSLACTGPGGASVPQSVNVSVSAVSPPAATVTSLVASPSSLQVGGSASLSWISANATSCVASGGLGGSDGWTGSVGTASAGNLIGPFPTAGTYTYTLTCTGPGGTGTATSVAVNVTAAATPAGTVKNFLATPSTVLVGQAASLSWGSDASTSCAASDGTGAWSGTMPASSIGTSTGAINAVGSYTFTLTCMGPGGAGSPSSVTVNVINPSSGAASIDAFTAASNNVSTGQGTTLLWATSNASSCTASGGSGFDSWGGTVATASAGTAIGPFTAAGIYTYTLNCTGAGGASGPSSVTVNVSTPPAQATVTSFIATPATLQAGGSALLSWTTSGATSCAASGGPGTGSWTGAEPTLSVGTSTGAITTPGSYTYILTCTGAAGVGPSSSAIVNVTSAPPPAAAVSSFTATPNSIVVGQSTSLAWSTTNATSCTATGGTQSDGWNGSVGTASTGTSTGAINTAGVYTYFLTCTGPGGTSPTQSVVLDVTAAPPAPSIIAFAVTPATVQTGQSTIATWTSLNATSCTASGGASGDGWGGAVAANSVVTTVGPESTAGNFTYSLTCTGPGGTSPASSASLTVTTTPVAPTIGSFTASPVAIQTGGSTKLSWNTTNAISCAASGGTSGDGWTGNVGTSSTGTTVGPINAAGIYIYTLTCTGAGGATSTASAIVTVTTATPPASIVSFLATPTTTTTGGSVILTWVTSGASACTASGGTGSDGWSGSQSTTTLGQTVGPLNTAGVYVYTLNCTGPGGASSPYSASVTVTSATPAATVGSFGAAPTSVSVGQSTALAWTSSNATSCTATGGTGADGWSGAEAPSSTSTTVGPYTTTGSVTYTLTCTGAGGTSAPVSTTVTVVPATPQQPTVSLKANGHSTLSVQTGTTVPMTWTSSNATACTASGGTGSDGWSGSEPVSTGSGSVSIGPISTPGTYAYTLTCSGPGGSGSSTVMITVMSANSVDCGIPGVATASMVSPAATATNTIQGLCVGCTVQNQANVINGATTSPATLGEPLSLLGGDIVLKVSQNAATFPAGRTVGFILTSGSSLLSLSALQSVTLTTYLNGVMEQSATVGNNLLTLQALGLLAVNSDAGFAGFTTTKPFNSVAVTVQQLAGVNTTVNVYRACVSLQ